MEENSKIVQCLSIVDECPFYELPTEKKIGENSKETPFSHCALFSNDDKAKPKERDFTAERKKIEAAIRTNDRKKLIEIATQILEEIGADEALKEATREVLMGSSTLKLMTEEELDEFI